MPCKTFLHAPIIGCVVAIASLAAAIPHDQITARLDRYSLADCAAWTQITKPPTTKPPAAAMAASSLATSPPNTASSGSLRTTSAARAKDRSPPCSSLTTTEPGARSQMQGYGLGLRPQPPRTSGAISRRCQPLPPPNSPRRSGGPFHGRPARQGSARRPTCAALAQGRSLEGTGAQHRRPWLEVVALIHSSGA